MFSDQITLLNQITLESFNETDETKIVKAFTDVGVNILGASFGFVWFNSPSSNIFNLVYKSPSIPYEPKQPRLEGKNYEVIKNYKLYIVENAEKRQDEYDVSPYLKSFIIIPIFYQQKIYGNIVLCFKEQHIFSTEDKILCTFIGNSVAQTITINRLMVGEHQARAFAEKQEARFRALIENSFDAIGLVSPEGEIVYASPSVVKFSGYVPEELVGSNMGSLIFPEDMALVNQGIQAILKTPSDPQTVAFRYRHKDGDWRWLEATWLNMISDPGIGNIIVNVRDITDRKNDEETIRLQALRDPLTDLPNRKAFGERFNYALEQARRHNRQLALMFLDMDRFKNINDRLGHSVGDTLLKVAASRFLSCLRPEDAVARFGGDEFLILINEIGSSKDATAAAAKILKAMSIPFKAGAHTLYPSVSIGIALYPQNGDDLETLKRKADIALYHSKNNGRNRFSFYDEEQDEKNKSEHFILENELREALIYDQIKPFYQPIVSLKNRKLVAVEALARWHHPTRGILLPADFIGLAEETGLIAELDMSILKQACAQAAQWREMGLSKFRVAVNLSAQRFCEPDFISGIAETLEKNNLDPGSLELEITESLAMGNLELTAFNLKALKKLGIKITIDDFGTGYSSLSYLKSFPISSLKIDKSFIRHCITNPQDTSITKTIIAMARMLNLKVVAEGVETLQQFDFLASMNCDYAQGFYISSPLDPAQMLDWLGVQTPKNEHPELIPEVFKI